ncbi:GcrA family cell cycle regulator [Rhizobium phaseoli]|uniref:GcrA family cell cycle regulator protein n=1 Tax=Rhizobium phaseoli TaxID=396 RepID=A0ABM6C8U2_9HYPH|nr:GcrA family cell cycle regulator [Rhizobium phaseoli]ANL84650.1 GcrA family cell cycle regulator protein [Rhizobium phaseoli]ANL91157.1 GcrA family cell cycle regulator protein [Rhizobium phaseoli]
MNMHAKVKRTRQPVWDDAAKQRMAAMWNDGYSATMIAANFEGASRMSILGLVHRNPDMFKPKKVGAPAYARTGGRKPEPKIPGAPRRKPKHDNVGNGIGKTRKVRMDIARRDIAEFEGGTSPCMKIAPSDAERLDTGYAKELTELQAGECRWVLNNGGPFLFCAEATGGATYCAHHAGRARAFVEVV